MTKGRTHTSVLDPVGCKSAHIWYQKLKLSPKFKFLGEDVAHRLRPILPKMSADVAPELHGALKG